MTRMQVSSINLVIVSVIASLLVPSTVSAARDGVCTSKPLQCEVTGEDSPESALRQVDEHALLSMYCTTGCDYAVNHAVPHAFSTYLKPSCYVEKQEHEVEYKKYNKDDKNDRRRRVSRWGRRGKRDIDAYTVGSATVKFCCSYQGQDYTVAAAKRIGLELSICDRQS